jgi:hypothetical protein
MICVLCDISNPLMKVVSPEMSGINISVGNTLFRTITFLFLAVH